MNDVLMIVMAAGAVLGGVDRLRGNKWGFGDKFESGFMMLGSMALSMAGMIPSSRDRYSKADTASSSVTATYSARPRS